MVIGYQVRDQHGNYWAGRRSFEILTVETALKEVAAARKRFPDDLFCIIAMVDGDIDEPKFENALAANSDQYKALGVCTSHLKQHEHKALNKLAADPDCGMIMGRDTGWFIKLYDEPESNHGYSGMSEEFHEILDEALKAGYRMVEFDCDACQHDQFKVFDY